MANLAGVQPTEALFHQARMKIIQQSLDDQMQRVEEGVRRLGEDRLSTMSGDDLVAAIKKEIASVGWLDLSDEANAKAHARPMTELLAFGVMPPDANERWDGGGRLGIFTKADISLIVGKIQGDVGQGWVDRYILANSQEEDNPADADGDYQSDDSSRPRPT